ncbi:GTP-binding protein Obg/CgtA [Durotheca rogersii]|uniref:GTP-binding protein Obg/CgtA n=1 Tax=Durotheca rogersii TaxID=419775 RepID=UPI00221EA280|nr:GTP-binding protein Obg/CgtA [Durotheca rogersii]KAI5868575.1 GTP-binding protein Obg/CgtA [Durotheca rogersii]
MAPRCSPGSGIFLPFLYPSLFRSTSAPIAPRVGRAGITTLYSSSDAAPDRKSTEPSSSSDSLPLSRLNPAPGDYTISTFSDKAQIIAHAGRGGNGCISFLREAYFPDGPADGGDGGHGGNIYIQAVHGESSLHKLVRRNTLRAGHGRTGKGSNCGGAHGENLVIQVPVGTVVREIERIDPTIEENIRYHEARKKRREYDRLVQEAEAAAAAAAEANGDTGHTFHPGPDFPEAPEHPNLRKFLLYPGISSSERQSLALPRLPRRDRLYMQPEAPIHLDLSTPTPQPILLAVGGVGGLGNPHFVSKDRPRPVFATRGESAVSIRLELELKLLADVGLVGLPNAGKSTLLRAVTRSRARVGNWAFTTLQPNIGTVVLDNHRGRPALPLPSKDGRSAAPQHAVVNDARYGPVVVSSSRSRSRSPSSSSPSPSSSTHHLVADDFDSPGAEQGTPRTRFTIADIPGLIQGAHLDHGLGIEFLRHVERAGVLAFVVDLSAGDAPAALRALWTEVGLYARMRDSEERDRRAAAARAERLGRGDPAAARPRGGLGSMAVAEPEPEPPRSAWDRPDEESEPESGGLHIAAKPWFAVATKADLPGTQDNYARLKEYLDAVTDRREPHPSGVAGAWTEDCAAIPVSAIHGHGVDRIVRWIVELLDGR